jgi:hypothetical protein
MRAYVLSLFIILSLSIVLTQISAVRADSYQVNYTVSSSNSATPQFVVQSLKYEPYPVNAGDWFDIWVKAQNIGTEDAPNAEFELVPNYPFTAVDSAVKDFGIVPGVWTAYSNKASLGDGSTQTNQVIMEFRVKVADNAPEGASQLQIKATTNKGSGNSVTFNIPVVVGKTKTDFDVVMQSASTQGISFALSNTGDNPATAITVSIPSQQGVVVSGASSSIIGNLDKGDFTTLSFNAFPQRNTRSVTMDIAYTDTAGVRNVLEKNVTIDASSVLGGLNASASGFTRGGTGSRSATSSSTSSLSTLLYIVIGAIVGAVIAKVWMQRKKKHTSHEAN